MALNVSAKGGKEFAPAPEGVHIAACVGVIDLGTRPDTFTDKRTKQEKTADKHSIKLKFELPGVLIPDGEAAGKPFIIWAEYTASLSEKANLRKALTSWRGRAFTEAELEAFDLEKLLGAYCQLQIIHETKKDRKYANIGAIMALPTGTPKPALTNPLVKFSLETFDQAVFDSFPEWLQDRIADSNEFKALEVDGASKPATTAAGSTDVSTDDDVPF